MPPAPYDPRIFQVQASYADNLRHVMVATSEGVLTLDRQPLARLNVSRPGARRTAARRSAAMPAAADASDLDFFLNEKTPEHFARKPRARRSSSSTPSMRRPAK